MLILKRNTFTPRYPRQEILKQINEADDWFCAVELPLEHIQDQMSWLIDKLELEKMSVTLEESYYFSYVILEHYYVRPKEERLITRRQEACFEACMGQIDVGHIGAAYHELHDFIDDAGRQGEFVSDLEIKGIKLMVEALNKKMKN